MPTKKPSPEEGARPEEDTSSEESLQLPYRGEVTVEISDTPPPPRHEKIHKRRPAPAVPEKECRSKGD
jgi:hypothetical protein